MSKMAPKRKYNEGEKILCYHGPLLYEAKCLQVQVIGKQVKYYVHYNGWNKNWDEWVGENRMLKYVASNLQKQEELKKLHVKEKKKKSSKVKSRGEKILEIKKEIQDENEKEVQAEIAKKKLPFQEKLTTQKTHTSTILSFKKKVGVVIKKEPIDDGYEENASSKSRTILSEKFTKRITAKSINDKDKESDVLDLLIKKIKQEPLDTEYNSTEKFIKVKAKMASGLSDKSTHKEMKKTSGNEKQRSEKKSQKSKFKPDANSSKLLPKEIKKKHNSEKEKTSIEKKKKSKSNEKNVCVNKIRKDLPGDKSKITQKQKKEQTKKISFPTKSSNNQARTPSERIKRRKDALSKETTKQFKDKSNLTSEIKQKGFEKKGGLSKKKGLVSKGKKNSSIVENDKLKKIDRSEKKSTEKNKKSSQKATKEVKKKHSNEGKSVFISKKSKKRRRTSKISSKLRKSKRLKSNKIKKKTVPEKQMPKTTVISTQDNLKTEAVFVFPKTLKDWIINDWYQINEMKKLVHLPARVTVKEFITMYKHLRVATVKSKKELNNKEFKIIDSLCDGLCLHFNTILGNRLLYRYERIQYADILAKYEGVPMVEIYGVIHLLRMLSNMNKYINENSEALTSREISILQRRIQDFVIFMELPFTFLLSDDDYEVAPPEYNRRALI